jgi:G3E family GTPase
MTDKIKLVSFLHPSMNIRGVNWDPKATFEVSPKAKIYKLMDEVEDMFEQATSQSGPPMILQINVLWNTKDYTKALNPNETVGTHFADGETFGVYGDVRPAPEIPQSIPEEHKLPVTILTGFLGAGKTTLLNYILQEQSEKKIAIIENEFGEVSIDDALIKEQKLSLAEKVVVMDNGCMCCTLRGDLVEGLQQILNTIEKGSSIDAIIIETTGMADPVPIVRTFMANPQLTMKLRLDGVVCVADAKHVVGRLDDKVEVGKVNEAYQQVAFADKILLNKIDLISAEEAISVKTRLRSINAFAKIISSVKGRVQLTELSNMRAHDMAHFTEVDLEKEAEVEGHGDGHGHDGGHGVHDGHGGGHGDGHDAEDFDEDHSRGAGHGHGHSQKKSRHDSRVNSFSIVREGEILPRKLAMWMQSLGTFPPEKGTIFRIKAILAVKDHPFKHVFHAVMDVSDEDDAGPWNDEKRISKIVFIGKDLDQQFIRQGWESIFA